VAGRRAVGPESAEARAPAAGWRIAWAIVSTARRETGRVSAGTLKET
jgi:hypothetical protein